MCCYYPTTIAAIDDDINLLKILTQHFGNTNCLAFSSPKTAIEIFSKQQPFQ